MTNISERIRLARLQKGLTQDELGKMIGVQKSAIAKWENGRVSEIKRSNLKRLSDALELNPNDLLDDIQNNSIGQKIKSARISKGMTQEDLGKIIGVQKAAVGKWESGRVVNIKRSVLQKITETLDITPYDLIETNTTLNSNEQSIEKECSKKIFAKNLKMYMHIFNVNQKELAEIIGVSAPTMNEWLNEKKFPRIDKIQKLADYFGIQKSDLIESKFNIASDEEAVKINVFYRRVLKDSLLRELMYIK